MSEICYATPNRKRKRATEKVVEARENTFSNAAFSSTPKKIIGRRRLNSAAPNINTGCMEEKSIADLVKEQREENQDQKIINPYEVLRKPPKKKKREVFEEKFCFENPALNLNVPEKQFNFYEVVRDQNKTQESKQKCFVNEALNIKGQDLVCSNRNPFEIEREGSHTGIDTKNKTIKNIVEENLAAPTNLKLGIPFTPTLGCRIDFNNVSLSELTPSKLMLSEKLIFSPVKRFTILPKRSLDAISEESSSVSIGKELDRYQLELENSINEAKLRKNDANINTGIVEEERVFQLQITVEKKAKQVTKKLTDIAENEEIEESNIQSMKLENLVKTQPLSDSYKKKALNNANVSFVEKDLNQDTSEQLVPEDNAGFCLDLDEEEDIDFKAPAPFVRAYRRDNIKMPAPKLRSDTESKLSSEHGDPTKVETGVKGLIRKSIRKIMPNHRPKEEINKQEAKETETKHCTLKSHIVAGIRHSLRRKTKPKDEMNSNDINMNSADVSIIDTGERKMKLKSCAPQNEYARIEELTNEKKYLLQGNLRRSTREMRHQIMKTIFQHKQEEYSFQK